jgi:presenilin-like A22 family membrane protease
MTKFNFQRHTELKKNYRTIIRIILYIIILSGVIYYFFYLKQPATKKNNENSIITDFTIDTVL